MAKPIPPITLRGWRLAAEATLDGVSHDGAPLTASPRLLAEVVINLLDEIELERALLRRVRCYAVVDALCGVPLTEPRMLGIESDIDALLEGREVPGAPQTRAPSGCVECTTRAEHIEHVRRLMQAGGGTVQLPPVVDLRNAPSPFELPFGPAFNPLAVWKRDAQRWRDTNPLTAPALLELARQRILSLLEMLDEATAETRDLLKARDYREAVDEIADLDKPLDGENCTDSER